MEWLTKSVLGATLAADPWPQVLALSGWEKPVHSMGENSATRQAKRLGLMTGGDLAKAAGISRTTLYRWMDEGRIPKLPEHGGVMALVPADLPGWVERCQALR